MSKISRFIFGAFSLTIAEERAKDVLNVLITNNIPFGRTVLKQGCISVCLTPNGYRKYVDICGGKLIFGEKAENVGLFSILKRYRMRVGMFVGILIFAVMLGVSTLFVWDINIVGNKNITATEIYEMLESHGFYIGTFIPDADTNVICSKIVLEAGNISFMKINMRGTVATVEIHEREPDPDTEQTNAPSNLVAKYDSQIERLEVLGGDVKVSYLQTVKKGELLVSGIIDSSALGYRTVRSRGKVWARATLCFESEIPFETEEKVYTGNEICKKSIIFFAKTINLSKNTNIPYEKYDTIVSKEKIYLFGIIELPISVTTIRYTEYRRQPRTLSENEALRRAITEINEKLDTELYGADILSRKTDVVSNGYALQVRTEIYCVIDIAEEVKIEIDQNARR